MSFRSIRRSLYIIILAIILQIFMMAVDLYLHQKHEAIEAQHHQFSELEDTFLKNLLLEKEVEHTPATKAEVLSNYRELLTIITQTKLAVRLSPIKERIHLNTDLFDLWSERLLLHTRLNTILPGLAGSVGYIHEHHIAYQKNLLRRGVLQQDYDPPEKFVRKDSQPGSELDIISAAIFIQNGMLDIMELFSRLQRGFSPKAIASGFNDAMKNFYEATNAFEDLSLDAQDGLLVEELLLNGATFEQSFKRFLQIESDILGIKKLLENNRKTIINDLNGIKKQGEEAYKEFNRRMEVVKYTSLFINICILVILINIAQKVFSALNTVVSETQKIEKDHTYRIPHERDNFKEITYIFNALNLMGKTVRKKLEELAHSQSMLEEQVRLRTEELLNTNVRLQAEIEEKERKESQRKDLEERLKRAEKMEVIGTLAGGVAHDLNNILSGIVSYPEYLLMDLPEDHKFHAPLQTIQESGKSAAMIVEDLLTMTRRGVARHEPLSINDLIKDFLESHEFRHIKTHHPRVKFISHPGADFSTINGSRIHLFKTLMNLISNAAEAIQDEGKVEIHTSNEYIDTVFKSYDEVNEGEYVKLTVQDDGVGISPENLERIFEPFFTTKTMGRSGSGLGMAVVWGTTKDLNGYIDVKSTLDEGSTFDLYFPLLRSPTDFVRKEEKLDDLKAEGEKILVVDDIKEQREIASLMLERLGYTVESVESGEEAIDFLQTHSIDILVLDMIMQPGLDGLETYRKILEFSPTQKAVIVSGFSESDKVQEAQKLGAGAYVKKPYTIKEIAAALRHELERTVK